MSLQPPAPAHPAATILLLRPAPKGFEVLLLLRAKAVKFAGGTWVFPGGRIDAQDAIEHSFDSFETAKTAAVRECHEEAGLQLSADDFTHWSHWTTPKVEKKRFSTWFLLGTLNDEQDVVVDDGEIVEYQWLTPEAALAKHRDQRLKLLPPTYLSLWELSQHNTITSVKAFCESRTTPYYTPKLVLHGDSFTALYEGDCAYETEDLALSGPLHRTVLDNGHWKFINTMPATGL